MLPPFLCYSACGKLVENYPIFRGKVGGKGNSGGSFSATGLTGVRWGNFSHPYKTK